MNKPTVYEQLGIIIPGAVLIFGLMLFFPSVREAVSANGVSLGELGVYILLSYAAGHLIAAVGNLGEKAWELVGGMPTDWVTKENCGLLSPQQVDAVQQKVRTRLGIAIERLRGLDRKVWFPISRQIYADVAKNGKPDRIEAFNGNYGLNRGLAAACLVLTVIAVVQRQWLTALLLIVFCGIYAYRAYRFGAHYGRELYMQFLTMDDTNPGASKRSTEGDDN
jgi:hypothetical protein